MALVIAEFSSELLSTSNASSYAMTAATPSANALLVCYVFATATVAAGSMTGGSLTWTKLTSFADAAGSTHYIFYAQAGASPASTAPTFDCTGDAATGALISCIQVTGHNTANPFAQYKIADDSGTSNPLITLDSAMNTNNGYFAGFACGRTTVTSTPPSSWTEIVDGGISTPNVGISTAFRVNGETGNTITFTSGTDPAITVFAVEINEASQGVSKPGNLSLLGVAA